MEMIVRILIYLTLVNKNRTLETPIHDTGDPGWLVVRRNYNHSSQQIL